MQEKHGQERGEKLRLKCCFHQSKLGTLKLRIG